MHPRLSEQVNNERKFCVNTEINNVKPKQSGQCQCDSEGTGFEYRQQTDGV
jgi:hypothetical protein